MTSLNQSPSSDSDSNTSDISRTEAVEDVDASDEQWDGQDQGYIGPNGEGQIKRENYDSDEAYMEALTQERNEGNGPNDREYERVDLGNGLFYDKGRIEVAFHREYGEARAREIVTEIGGIWQDDDFAWDLDLPARVDVYFPGDVDEAQLRARFEAYEEVDATYLHVKSYSNRSIFDSIPNDPKVADQSYLDKAGFIEAWDTVRCDWGIEVAIIDSGYDFDHEDFDGIMLSALAYDAQSKSIFREGYTDTYCHGTSVTGVVVARTDNAIGIAGAAYNVDVLPIRICASEDYFEWDQMVDALAYISQLPDDQLPDVVNMSFSETEEKLIESGLKQTIESEIKTLRDERGIVFVAAAGNYNPKEESASALYMRVYPAAFESVLAVGAVDEDGLLTDWSKRYKEVDICAYGDNVLTTFDPDIVHHSYYATLGTSFAAPQVAAAAALVKKAHPGYTAQNIEDALLETALSAPEGIAEQDLPGYGKGVLDAKSAIMWSTQMKPGSGSGGTSGDWSPTAGGSLYEKYMKTKSAEGVS